MLVKINMTFPRTRSVVVISSGCQGVQTRVVELDGTGTHWLERRLNVLTHADKRKAALKSTL